jgi:hypothetical protein
MNMARNKLTKKQVPAMLLKAFPDYNGRKFSFNITKSVYLQNYWSGGTRYFVKLVNLITGEIKEAAPTTENPFRPEAHGTFEIPKDWCVVEHILFCGKDLGLCFNISPQNAPPFLSCENTKQA